MIKDKKGMELSINMIVVIILGIAMLATGIALFGNIIQKGQETTLVVDQKTEELILNQFFDNSQIYIPKSAIDVKNDAEQILFAVQNIYSEQQDFWIDITSVGNAIENNKIAYLPGPYNLGSKGKSVYTSIVDTKGLGKGQYGIAIKVFTDASKTQQYGSTKIVYLNIR